MQVKNHFVSKLISTHIKKHRRTKSLFTINQPTPTNHNNKNQLITTNHNNNNNNNDSSSSSSI